MNNYFDDDQLTALELDVKTIPTDGEGRTLPVNYDEHYVRNNMIKLIADLRSSREETAKQKFRFEYTENLVKKAHAERDRALSRLNDTISRKALDEEKIIERANGIKNSRVPHSIELNMLILDIESGAFDIPSTESEGEADANKLKAAAYDELVNFPWVKDNKLLRAEKERLRAFAKQIIQAAWDGGQYDGAEIQDIGVTHGLLRKEGYDPDKHGSDYGYDFAPGDPFYVYTEVLNDLISPTSDTAVQMIQIGEDERKLILGWWWMLGQQNSNYKSTPIEEALIDRLCTPGIKDGREWING